MATHPDTAIAATGQKRYDYIAAISILTQQLQQLDRNAMII
jgi:hypothetical protein